MACWLALVPMAVACAQVDAPNEGTNVSPKTEFKHTNNLIHATSPYLLQHAHNPVNWYEWGEAAFSKAKKEDKPIFLSIGYSACHWCHVMEHESFESDDIADILNRDFVAIKVDREERPDIDEIYMQATIRMTRRGGWPMSLFITSSGEPFFAGTYFPKPQLEQLLIQVADQWSGNRQALLDKGSEINAYLRRWASQPREGGTTIPADTPSQTANLLVQHFDMHRGGFRTEGNKFPPSMAMELMLRTYIRESNPVLLDAVDVTLTHMANGGIYDQLGGGICRYSTDPNWLVPHFEKMLYDQGLVSSIFLDAYQVARKPLFADTARGILDYVIGDLQSSEGGFYSTRDADSEGMEGKFYIWTVEQVTHVLGPDDGKIFCDYYDVTEKGNWFESRGHAPAGAKNILNVQRSIEQVAKDHDTDPAALEKRLAGMRHRLLEARAKRVPPGLDDKILTAWNGLMIASLAKGARVLDEPRYAVAAEKAADFVLSKMTRDGKLLRSYRNGRARLTGYLSDYAFLTEGLINLYEATFDVRWLDEAVTLTDDMIARYFDREDGAFFFTASDGETLVARTKDANDGAVPSGNSVAAMNLLRLGLLVNRKDYREKAESIFGAFAPLVARTPNQFERLLCAVDFYYGEPREIAIVGQPNAPDTTIMLKTVFRDYRPNKIVTFSADPTPDPKLVKKIPLLRAKRRIDNKATAYVCRNYVCKKPTTSVAELAATLKKQ